MFSDKVIQGLEDWDQKAKDIALLSEKYRTDLD